MWFGVNRNDLTLYCCVQKHMDMSESCVIYQISQLSDPVVTISSRGNFSREKIRPSGWLLVRVEGAAVLRQRAATLVSVLAVLTWDASATQSFCRSPPGSAAASHPLDLVCVSS